jgi:hypothetical protein
MKWLAITVAIASLMACSGGSGVGNPTAPTTLVTNANVSGPSAEVSGSYNGTITASSTCSANLPPEARVLGFTATIAQTAAGAPGATLIWGEQGHSLWHGLWPDGQLSELLV